MSALAPPPRDPLEYALDRAAIGLMLTTRLVALIAAAWADDAYPDARDDIREMLMGLAADAREARDAGDALEADGCERACDNLSALWADATDKLICPESGHPAWDGLADRLWDHEPVAPLEHDP